MKICHVCKAECDDELEFCSVCGAELIETFEEKSEESKEEFLINNPVLAACVEDVVTAEIFRDMLSENGIAYALGENEESIKLVFGGSFVSEEIYVDEKDLERAQEIYDEVLNAEPVFDEDFEELEE